MELKIGSIPLRIRGQFFLMALLLGMSERDPAKLAIWMVVILVSLVVHELGHALVGKAFGLTPRIELYGMGGVTVFEGERENLSAGRSVAISFAGAFAGFLFALLVYAAGRAGFHPAHPLARYAVSLLLVVNIAWGLFNLVPMLPLDGGNILRTLLLAGSKTHGDRIARVISIVFAGAIGIWAVTSRQWWILYLGVLFLFQNVQALRHVGVLKTDQVLVDAMAKAKEALDRDAARDAIDVLKPALQVYGSIDVRRAALRMYIVALVRDGRFREVMEVIEHESAVIGPDDLGQYAQGMRELGRADDAERIDELVKAPAPLTAFRA